MGDYTILIRYITDILLVPALILLAFHTVDSWVCRSGIIREIVKEEQKGIDDLAKKNEQALKIIQISNSNIFST